MISFRIAWISTVLVVAWGCASDKHASDGMGGASSGGTAGEAGSETFAGGDAVSSGGTTVSAGGQQAPSSGGSSEPVGAGGGTPAPESRCADETTGQVVLTHDATEGQPNSMAGTTTVTAGSVGEFDAGDLQIELCFSVVGSAPLTAVSGMAVDYAAISGGSANYVGLGDTPLVMEATGEHNRDCIVFEVGSATGASGVMVSGETEVTYSWRFDEKGLDPTVMFDPRDKNAPELKAVLGGSLAACQVLQA